MNRKSKFRQIMAVRGMGAALTAFVGLIVIYVAFGLIQPQVFSVRNILNLLRSMSKYLLIGVGQSYLLITGNIDLSIGSVVAMSAMISATLMSAGVTCASRFWWRWSAAWPWALSMGCWWANSACPRSSRPWAPCLSAAA